MKQLSDRIRLLGIVPLEGIKTQMLNLSADYPQIDMELFVGNTEQALEIASSRFAGSYDVVVSRGGTAQMLRNCGFPVVEIEISSYDILCALKLSNVLNGKIAMVAYANIIINAQNLCTLLGYDLDVYTVDNLEDLEPTLRKLQMKQYSVVLCDTTANILATQMGMNAILITSGVDSIRHALDQALMVCQGQVRLREESAFFRNLLECPPGQIVVLDRAGALFFSTVNNLSPDFLPILRRELLFSNSGVRRVTRNLNGTLYCIQIRPVTFEGIVYAAFYLEDRQIPPAHSQTGISYCSGTDEEQIKQCGIFTLLNTDPELRKAVLRLSESPQPLVVVGETGTCKDAAVSFLYAQGTLRNRPLVSINCSLLNEKSLDFLLMNANSPLSDARNTIYFSGVEALSDTQRLRIIDAILKMNACRRHRIIFSCTCKYEIQMPPECVEFLNRLGCQLLYLPPLRMQPEQFATLTAMLLSQLNLELERPVLNIEPEALRSLQEFRWPYNHLQFYRVIKELAFSASDHIITSAMAIRIIRQERNTSSFSCGSEESAAPLNLNRSLHEIDRDIAFRVLNEVGGNRTEAARRLGIGRTTFWRLIQNP